MKTHANQWLVAAACLITTGCGSPEAKVAPETAHATPEAVASAKPEAGPSPEASAKRDTPAPAEAPKIDPKLKRDEALVGSPEMIQQAKKLGKAKVGELSQSDWKQSDMTPMQIAQAADSAIGVLHGAVAETSLQVKNPAGTGQAVSKMQIQDPAHYHVEYIEVVNGEPHTMMAVADGKRRGVLIASSFVKAGGWHAKAAIGSQGSIPAGGDLVGAWPTQFPRLILSQLLESRGGVSAYLAALSNGVGNYVLTSEKRVIPYNGRMYTSYRIVAQRGEAAAKAQGSSRIEMVFDGHFRLPVSVRTNAKPIKGKPTDMLWATGWSFNKSFPAKTFEMPSKLG